MDPSIVKLLHDAFRRALDDETYLQAIERLQQQKWYRSTEDYTRWAGEQYEVERRNVIRFGLKQ